MYMDYAKILLFSHFTDKMQKLRQTTRLFLGDRQKNAIAHNCNKIFFCNFAVLKKQSHKEYV